MINHKNLIAAAFNKVANNYETVAQMQIEIGERLFERLFLLKIKPKFILDLGCGTGYFTKKLKNLYPSAYVVSLDMADDMLKQVKLKQSFFKKFGMVNADMHKLPFMDGQFDLVFSNQVVHWSNNFAALMAEIYRVMAKDGCLMFSTLGPDTFQELRQAFSYLDNFSHVNEFMDMHDLGDILYATNYADPVIDMEMLTAHYESLPKMLASLKKQGVINISSNRKSTLSGKNTFKKLELAMTRFITENTMYPLTYEVVFGHAWKFDKKIKLKTLKNTFSVDELKKTIRTH